MERTEHYKEPTLDVVDTPERKRWSGDGVLVQKAPNWGQKLSEDEIRFVIQHPELTFEEAGAHLGRSPGSVNRIRVLAR